MRQLGNTLEAIAAEKAGIIKPGVPVVNGAVQEGVSCVIEGVARAQGAPLYNLERDFEYRYLGSGAGRGGVVGDGFSAERAIPVVLDPAESRGSESVVEGGSGVPCQFGRMDYRGVLAGRAQHFDELAVGLLGRHQVANAAVALAALSCLAPHGFRIEEPAIRAGLGQLRCPARIEVVCRRPTVIVDVAHNAASVAALTAVLDESFAAPRRVLVMAASKEKDVCGMLEHLLPRFQHVVFTRYVNNPRSIDPHKLVRLALPLVESRSPQAPAPGDIVVCPTPRDAWQHVQAIVAADDVVVLTGSFFLAAEMRALAQAPLTLSASPAVHVA
jgi:dihydrofolate synthase/folylpolyglutamate synthase